MDDSFSALGLMPMELTHQAVLEPYFRQVSQPLSDYTFANAVIWARAINVHWAILGGCLCVFANGAGDLTLLLPPLGPAPACRGLALDEALARCRQYNIRHGVPHATRVEYVSSPWLSANPVPADWSVAPMSGDYVYETARMIELDGPELASKRQCRNRFARRHQARTARYVRQLHEAACLQLLECWERQVRNQADQAGDAADAKRNKELLACRVALAHHDQLGLTGMVLFAGDELAGFTFGEPLGEDSFSVLIEKTDRRFVGAAQFIFSEFCKQFWAARKWCNVGDDWGIENLARVKESYRPSYRLSKFTLRPPAITAAVPEPAAEMLGVDPLNPPPAPMPPAPVRACA